MSCDYKKLKPLKCERHAPLSVITHDRKAIFSVKNYLPKTHEVYKATRSSPAFLSVTKGHDTSYLHLFLWSSSYNKALSSEENVGIDAWHDKKFTMLRFTKPHDLFHLDVNYREAWNGNVNYRDSLFVIFNSGESCEGLPPPLRYSPSILYYVFHFELQAQRGSKDSLLWIINNHWET